MLKQVKRNKHLKWIDSRYAKPYRMQRAIYAMRISQIAATGLINHKQIASGVRRPGKASALALNAIRVCEAINLIPKPKGRVSLEPPPMNNHKE